MSVTFPGREVPDLLGGPGPEFPESSGSAFANELAERRRPERRAFDRSGRRANEQVAGQTIDKRGKRG